MHVIFATDYPYTIALKIVVLFFRATHFNQRINAFNYCGGKYIIEMTQVCITTIILLKMYKRIMTNSSSYIIKYKSAEGRFNQVGSHKFR